MKLLHSLPSYNFAGLGEEYSDFKKAKVVVLPVPFDSTVTWGVGTRNAPHSIISASRFLELYDHELDFETYKIGIHTLDELEPVRGSAEETIVRVKQAVTQIVDAGKFPLVLGGEHSITFGTVDALGACCGGDESFSVISFDAHADLWDEYEGSPLSHACVMRRIREIVPNVVEIGVRSISKAEKEYAGENEVQIIYSNEVKQKTAEEVFDSIKTKLKTNVFVSIDLDVFDTSLVSTGTPEPDGLSWSNVADLLALIAKEKNVIGFDMVELVAEQNGDKSSFFAARLGYKFFGQIFSSRKN